LGVSKPNWDNAKKILPAVAEQLGDVVRRNGGLYPATPARPVTPVDQTSAVALTTSNIARVSARRVTSDSIATTRPQDDYDETVDLENSVDPGAIAAAISKREERRVRHNQLVQSLAGRFEQASGDLWEGVFDCIGAWDSSVVLVEVKTLDGQISDEIRQVRSAAAQLLYYAAFDVPQELATRETHLVACFENKPSDRHVSWLNELGIAVVWPRDGEFVALGDGKDDLNSLGLQFT
jgi:hypothetical protein